MTTQNDNYFRPNGQISLNYKNTFGKHDIGALVLWEFYNDRTDILKAYRQFTVGALDQIDAGDKTNINNGGTARVSAHAGLVGRLNYAYDNKYLAELSFRYDGSYKFARTIVGDSSLPYLWVGVSLKKHSSKKHYRWSTTLRSEAPSEKWEMKG